MTWKMKEKCIGIGFGVIFAFIALLGVLVLREDSTPILIAIVSFIALASAALSLWIYDAVRTQVVEGITAEAKARGIQTFMEMLFDHIPNMIFVKEAKNLRFTIFNKAGEELLNCKREDLLGKNDFDLFPAEQAQFFTSKDREVLANKKLLDIPVERIDTPVKGTRILHTKKIPLLDKNGEPRYLLGISEDITDQLKFPTKP